MLKKLSNLGIVLNKSQKQSINGSAAAFCSERDLSQGCVVGIRACICTFDRIEKRLETL